MNPGPNFLSLYQPACYTIRVAGRLEENGSSHFEGKDVAVERLENGAALTRITGRVADQSELHGLLALVRDLGLPLVSVELISCEE